jgi:hypothetical protein
LWDLLKLSGRPNNPERALFNETASGFFPLDPFDYETNHLIDIPEPVVSIQALKRRRMRIGSEDPILLVGGKRVRDEDAAPVLRPQRLARVEVHGEFGKTPFADG